MVSTKTCRDCGETKPLSDFYKHPQCRDGHFPECKVCRAAYAKRYREKNREQLKAKSREYWNANLAENNAKARQRYHADPLKYNRKNKSCRLKREYGLTIDEWEALFESQSRSCVICGTTESSPYWHTDHCHSTNTVRAILCFQCNTGLGHFRDRPELLLLAHAYMTSFG
jgi:hypothetical protein